MPIIENISNCGAEVIFSDISVNIAGVHILDKINATVPKGECTAIVGPNGAGKTTLLMTLLNEIPYTGTVTIASYEHGPKHRIGYVPQRLSFDRGMPLTVLDFMIMDAQIRPLWLGKNKKAVAKALEILAQLHAEKLANRKIGALSGGELQRVLLALALQQKPELLILDEPAAGVDFKGEYIFCELLEKMRKQMGFTQLMISHDLPTVTHHATKVICLNRKVIAQGSPKETLTHENLTAMFGIHMGMIDLKALPNNDKICNESCCKHG